VILGKKDIKAVGPLLAACDNSPWVQKSNATLEIKKLQNDYV
jgi:hypothetical protein